MVWSAAEVPGTSRPPAERILQRARREIPRARILQRYREMAEYLDNDLVAMPFPKIKPLHLSREWNRLLTSEGRGRVKAPEVAGLAVIFFRRAAKSRCAV